MNHLYKPICSYFVQALISVGLMLATHMPTLAASSEWSDIGGGKARLLAVLSPDTGIVTGGVEIKLDDGWKTYWRSPGDAGIPPLLDFSKSRGISVGETLLPAPTNIVTPDVSYVGYKKQVTYVFEANLLGSGQSGNLSLNMLLGVCEEICIPAQAQFELPLKDLHRSDPASQSVLESAKLNLPLPPTDTFQITEINVDNDKDLNISVRVPDSERDNYLFAEGPSGWYLTPVKPSQIDDGIAQFKLSLKDIPNDADVRGTELRYTLVSGTSSIEEYRKPD